MRKLNPSPSISALSRPFTIDKYLISGERTLADVRDDLRLKRALQRAIEKDRAPQSLIDTIRNGIRA